MPKVPMLFCEIFDVWGMNFIRSFPSCFSCLYILLAVDYVSKWIETKATQTNDSQVVAEFLKSTFLVGLVCQERSSVTKVFISVIALLKH